jgi:large subunit ribosomal protein L15
MVVRKEKRSRKYLGTRRWGAGNVKNARGSGDRGGVGRGGRKHKFTYMTAKTPELIKRRGFTPFGAAKMDEITLDGINRLLKQKETAGKGEIELRNCKVLSNGTLEEGVRIKASAFSKKAIEKIKSAGGEALLIGAA